MSAFVVSHSTIAAIVTFAHRRLWSCVPPPPYSGCGTVNIRDIDPDRIGQALLAENVRSVNYRYRRSDPVARYRHVPTYAGAVSTELTRTLTALDAVKLAHCLEYQSSEHPEWATSWARDFLQRVVDTAVHELPGYDAAPWGLYGETHRHVAHSGEGGHCLRSEGGHDYGGKADSITVMADTPLPSTVAGVSGGSLVVKC